MKIMLLIPAIFIVVSFAYARGSGVIGRVPLPQIARSRSHEHARPALLALLFRADWCSACARLEREYLPLQRSLAREPILFARFDFTNRESTEEARELADRLGVQRVYRQAAGKTGFVLLVDPPTKRLFDAIKISATPAQMKATFRDALDRKLKKSGSNVGLTDSTIQNAAFALKVSRAESIGPRMQRMKP